MDNLATATSCDHAVSKVYSGECLGAFNDVPHHDGQVVVSWYWICAHCLEVGSDFFETAYRPFVDAKAYWKKMRERDPSCFVPQAYR